MNKCVSDLEYSQNEVLLFLPAGVRPANTPSQFSRASAGHPGPASSDGRRKGMRIAGRGISMAAIPEHHRLGVQGERKRSLWNTF